MSSSYDPQHNPSKDVTEPPMRKKCRKKLIFIPLVLLFAAITAFMLWPAEISRHEAQEIAIAHVGSGTVSSASRDFERFQRVWSVEVFYNNLIHEVYVNMKTGEVVAVEIDRWH